VGWAEGGISGFVPGYARFGMNRDIFAVQWRVCTGKVGALSYSFLVLVPSSTPSVHAVSFFHEAQVKGIWSRYYFTFVLLTSTIPRFQLRLSTCMY
jgi:hypothetical protein